jgi:hypothetical protein
MNCSDTMEKLAECARRRIEPEPALQAHLKSCDACFEAREAERNLSDHLRMIRIAASTRRSSAASRDTVMRKFAEKHRAAATRRWLWSLAAAAAVLLAIFLLQRVERRPAAPADIRAEADFQEDAAQYDGFIPVPYVPPLATGELLSVVHTDLYPSALASLGVSVDPTWATELPADLLVGEDGFPRAVRVSADYFDERGY